MKVGHEVLRPVKSLLLPDIDIADAQQKNEYEHLQEDEPGDAGGSQGGVAVDDGPRIEEGRFDVEQDEQHRDLIETHVDALPVLIEERDTALIRRELRRIALLLADHRVEHEEHRSQRRRGKKHQEDGYETVGHGEGSRCRNGANANTGHTY